MLHSTHKPKYIAIFLTLFANLSGNASFADTEVALELGIASITAKSPVKGEKSKTQTLPYLDIRYGRWHLGYEGLSYHLPLRGNEETYLQFSLSTSESVYDTSDNKVLKHLDEPNTATEFSLAYNQPAFGGEVSIFASGDISDTHNGYSGGLALEFELPISERSGLIVIPSLTVHSAASVDYFYGISKTSATATIGAYKGKASTELGLGVFYVRGLSEHWSALAGIDIRWLGDGIRNSSIVDQSTEQQAFIALIYSF